MKRIILSLMAICLGVSSFALSANELVYTPQGRFMVSGDNIASSDFSNLTSWMPISATEGIMIEDIFNINSNGYAEGLNSVKSISSTAGEGMYFKFEPSDAFSTYIVSFKMKGDVGVTVRTSNLAYDGNGKLVSSTLLKNCVKIAGNSAHVYGNTEDELIANKGAELSPEWQTYNYAIVGDGMPRTYYVSFIDLAASIEIADLQIAPAYQVADLHQRDVMLEKLKIYMNCYNWSDNVWTEHDGYKEIIDGLEALNDESTQADLNELLGTAQEVLAEFLKDKMDDYFAGNIDNYFGSKATKTYSKVGTIGDWSCLPSGRAWFKGTDGNGAEFGHYQQGTKWNYGASSDPMGAYMQKVITPGSYVFSIEGNAAMREDYKQTWVVDEGLKAAYAVVYIKKVADAASETDTLLSVVQEMDPIRYTEIFVPVKIAEEGLYEIGAKVYCKEAYRDYSRGSVVYLRNAALWGKNENVYNQKQLGYEADVREQITTGRTNLTTATENIKNADFFWGKATLQACVDTVEVKIAAYEAMSQDDIIATYQEDYVKSTTEETGYMVREVYQEAVKDIIAANKKFVAVNDTLASIQASIDAAENVKGQRLYDAATGKDALQTAIDKAKDIQTAMKATEYSVENAAAIVAANAELAEAVETFKNTVPASAIATIVDIDFEQDAVQDETTTLYSVPGATGSMEFSKWSTDGTGSQPFEKGFWSNGEQLWKGYIRVGNGTGTVVFDPTEDGSMGTNILKVACDLYVQGLSGKSLGFFLKSVNENGNDEEVFGIYRNFYSGETSTNTCDVDVTKIWSKSGGSYNNASPADAEAETLTANPLQKTHFEVILDYGRKSMYCTINSIVGSTTSKEVSLETIPTKFILQSNYNNNDRRAWFDNLMIERITAGPTDPLSGITGIEAAKTDNGAIYNLAGQKVNGSFKGVVIKNGKKMIQR